MTLLAALLAALLATPSSAAFRAKNRGFSSSHRASHVTRAAHVAARTESAPASPAWSAGQSFSAPSGWSTSHFARPLSARRFDADPASFSFYRSAGVGTRVQSVAVSQTFASAAGSPIAVDESRMTPVGGAGVRLAGATASSSSAAPAGDGTIMGMANAMTAALDKMLKGLFGGLK